MCLFTNTSVHLFFGATGHSVRGVLTLVAQTTFSTTVGVYWVSLTLVPNYGSKPPILWRE